MPALETHLAAQGFPEVKVVPVTERDAFLASRTDPDDPWVRAVGASGPSEYFWQTLGTPVIWIPHSYGGCGPHGPDEPLNPRGHDQE